MGLGRKRWLLPALLGVALLAVLWLASRDENGARTVTAGLVSAAGQQDPSGFERAVAGRPIRFPEDHGPHNDFQTEWWYYTGNLTGPGGERYGFQLTFFRRAIAPPDQRVTRPSPWAAEQLYLAHFAVTDVAGGRHYGVERISRAAAGLAGAQASPYRVWLDDWEAVEEAGGDAVRLRARTEEFALDLMLASRRDPVLQGDQGFSRKGSEPGNASHYYSLTRLETAGTVEAGGRSVAVQGLSWMDHEFSTSALAQGQVGWDWFSLQLDDGSDLMVFRLRRADGTPDPFASGTLVRPDGSRLLLGPGDFALQATARWRSPHTRAEYPAAWILEVPGEKLRLEIRPHLADQEMRVSYFYWEGAVGVTGGYGDRPVAGNGYVELTGYAGSMQGQF